MVICAKLLPVSRVLRFMMSSHPINLTRVRLPLAYCFYVSCVNPKLSSFDYRLRVSVVSFAVFSLDKNGWFRIGHSSRGVFEKLDNCFSNKNRVRNADA
jgi:hypothetical protein